MITVIFATTLLTTPIAAGATQQVEAVITPHKHAHKVITTDELKSWYDQKKPMLVLDARSKQYFNGKLLPDAQWLTVESSDEQIIAAAPDKNATIVVYCAGLKCPASGWLADKLEKLGYTNVVEYSEGLEGWEQKGYPIVVKQ